MTRKNAQKSLRRLVDMCAGSAVGVQQWEQYLPPSYVTRLAAATVMVGCGFRAGGGRAKRLKGTATGSERWICTASAD
jgi:hypothetical protein